MKMMKNRVEIEYCTQCGWLLRSSWMAQELLTTFVDEINELVLKPATGGIFIIQVNGQRVWSRKDDCGFPDITELKRRVRDVLAPDKSLGHIDRASDAPGSQ